MNKTFSSLLTVLALGTPSAFAQNPEPTPFVETSTLTFFWGLSSSYISNVSNPVPVLSNEAVFDPEQLPTGFESYVDTVRAQAYTGSPQGAIPAAMTNRDMINYLLQTMIRSGRITRVQADYGRWQLIAVREAPTNVRELATNPYRIFLSVISPNRITVRATVPELTPEDASDDPIPTPLTFDTGLTFTLGASSGTYTETNFGTGNDTVVAATGSVTTAFSIDLGALFYEDPLHEQDRPNDDPYNYHLTRNYWRAQASGLITFNVRTIPGPLATFVATNAAGTGTGWFFHNHREVEYVNGVPRVKRPPDTYTGAGLAPMRLNYSTIQYQKRTVFFPIAPTNLTGSALLDSTAVNLSWVDNSFDEDSFVVERRTAPNGPWSILHTTDPDALIAPTVYSDDTVQTDVTYDYRVQAINLNGGSTYSNIFTITPVEIVPKTPTALIGDPDAAGTSVAVSWTDNSAVETNFVLERRLLPAGAWTVIHTTPNVQPTPTTYTDNTVVADSNYAYRVKATNANGESNLSAVTTVSTLVAPTDLIGTPAVSADSVSLSWTDNSGAEDGYVVERRALPAGNWGVIGLTAEDETTYDDDTVTEATTYQYRVNAFDALGDSASTAPIDVVVPAAP